MSVTMCGDIHVVQSELANEVNREYVRTLKSEVLAGASILEILFSIGKVIEKYQGPKPPSTVEDLAGVMVDHVSISNKQSCSLQFQAKSIHDLRHIPGDTGRTRKKRCPREAV